MKAEAQKEGLSEEIRKLKKEVDQDLQSAAESEKFKKIKKWEKIQIWTAFTFFLLEKRLVDMKAWKIKEMKS